MSLTSIKYKLLFNSLFVKPFWRFLRDVKTRRFGLVTINLTKSYYFEIFRTLKIFLSPQKSFNFSKSAILKFNDVKYAKPIGVLPFSFQKTSYNTFIFFLFFRLISISSILHHNMVLHSYLIWFPRQVILVSMEFNLIFTENSLPVNKLADMINRPNAKWIAPRGTALESFIKVQ